MQYFHAYKPNQKEYSNKEEKRNDDDDTGEVVELDGVIEGSGRKAGGVGAKGEGGDAVAVEREGGGGRREEERVVYGNGEVGGGGGDQVVGLLVPQHGAEARAALGLVPFSQLHRSHFHARPASFAHNID